MDNAFRVMPAQAGIHDFSLIRASKSWMAGLRPP